MAILLEMLKISIPKDLSSYDMNFKNLLIWYNSRITKG